jgi:hypothetical protein
VTVVDGTDETPEGSKSGFSLSNRVSRGVVGRRIAQLLLYRRTLSHKMYFEQFVVRQFLSI